MGEPMGSDLVVGEWSWAPVEEVVGWARFWASAPWPMTRGVAIDLGVEHLGWSVNEEGEAVVPWPLNGRDLGLSRADGAKDCYGFSFKATDVIGLPREQLDPEEQGLWEAFLRDRFTLLVRALTHDLGKPKRMRENDLRGQPKLRMRWDLPDGGIRWDLLRSVRSVDVYVSSPESAQVERNLGN